MIPCSLSNTHTKTVNGKVIQILKILHLLLFPLPSMRLSHSPPFFYLPNDSPTLLLSSPSPMTPHSPPFNSLPYNSPPLPSGVHAAMQHDTIMNSSDPDYVLVESEAKKVAQSAARAMKQSRQHCMVAGRLGRPTWTGQHGVIGAPAPR